ncbi:hypothetical protein NP493_628g00008 [Ridgeia piscesae]|uniref:CUB domain-containing protein n=1 Tax=Ridgeia piscesae TaxID=27915 RepID=A0AAD9KSP0_RIDPI|nr:hypothetical protein NP493_628g00008 [Ridgeia piscesae]
MDVNDCGDSCWIFSPGYPGIYPPNVTCQYRIITNDSNTMLQLTFDNKGTGHITYLFDVTSGAYLEFIVNIYGLRGHCDDEVLIYNGTTLVTTLCNAHVVKRQTRVFYVDSRRSSLIYRTTSGQLVSEPDRGFWLSFRLVDGRSETRVFICGCKSWGQTFRRMQTYDISKPHRRRN